VGVASRRDTSTATIFTIGFTKTSAESFFTRLQSAAVKKVVDVRLSNTSQLAGFAKKDDLRYFLRVICGIDYEHWVELAPTPELRNAYKKDRGPWSVYEAGFLELMSRRQVDKTMSRDDLDGACLLCSEPRPEQCHRSLVAEYLKARWGNIEIVHL
jgi:uncharacterized protein (DUF488 family)